jgi:peptidoglycan hydrolase-like protein with peptidoglycan-binding domain
MRHIVMPTFGCCQHIHVGKTGGLPGLAPLGAGTGPVEIDKPVGSGFLARNLTEDVKAIQEALNAVPLAGGFGGAVPPLVVDGLCGPKTRAAISHFQRTQFKSADGLVEPGKRTVQKLNEILGEPVTDEDMRKKVQSALPIARDSVAAALRNLTASITTSGLTPTPEALVARDRLDRHFRMKGLPEQTRRNAELDLFRAFTLYLGVISDQNEFDIAPVDEFDLDRANPKIALTTDRGFVKHVGEVDPETGDRLDRIRFGTGFLASSVTPDFAAHIIVHEVTHFVGTADGELIDDFGRGWFDDPFVRFLTHRQRMRNADSYGTFAHECRVNSPARPGFITTAPGGLGGAR